MRDQRILYLQRLRRGIIEDFVEVDQRILHSHTNLFPHTICNGSQNKSSHNL